ncbi:MAG: outer membrane protein assembly factor BamA [Motiliproteus sp.]|nr:outer membrane protein assembly factor BamA [Motiliproteus sp.]MCW9054066.1 outer membrane protein assembly factor BamA [Motiliproteus sp.]
MRRKLTLLLIGILFPVALWADSFQVSDIRVDGLRRLDLGTVFRAFPVDVGDQVDSRGLADAARTLFASGYFNDIQLLRDGDLLIVRVKERPALSNITIEGNKVIETEPLLEGLKDLGLQEGEVFQRATLERIRLELSRLYAAQGRYGAWIEAGVEELPENRVGLTINIKEGEAATIRHINIVGNEVFTDEELTRDFELGEPGLLPIISNNGKYAREKLSGDLERLRTFYLNRGYINFRIESTQVSLTTDRKHVYVTINVHEGDLYYFGGFQFAGDLEVPEEELHGLVSFQEGDVFSRKAMVDSADKIQKRFGRAGFIQANVNPNPDIDEENNRINITFSMSAGRRIYVRRINFRGNTTSVDEVLRREMRQMEAAYANSFYIEKSKSRLERLSYFNSVNVETVPVPGSEDQVDLEYSVVEQLSGNLSASVGFSQRSGLLLALSVSQENFLGSGKNVSVGINNSDTDTEYSFSYTDPYYTVDGVSRGFSLFFRKEDRDEDDLSNYALDSFGGSINFGYPIDEFQRLRFSVGYENIDVQLGSDVPTEITDFVVEEGDNYNVFKSSLRWSENRLNRGVLATRGYSQALTFEASVPGSDISYFTLKYRGQRYFPITHGWLINLETDLGYGDSYGDTSELPFFKHFFSGGFSSVRGFKNNTLGPKGSNVDEDPLGGNVLIEGTAELIFPFPFVEDRSKLRSLLFIDVGSVFDTSCLSSNLNCDSGVKLDDLRASVGVGVSWITFIGPLSFSIATPILEKTGDETEVFQFALGQTF